MLPPCLKVLLSVLEMFPCMIKYPLCFSLICLSSCDSHSRPTVRIYLKFPKYAFHMIFLLHKLPFSTCLACLLGLLRQSYSITSLKLFCFHILQLSLFPILISCYFVIIAVAPNQSFLGLLPPVQEEIGGYYLQFIVTFIQQPVLSFRNVNLITHSPCLKSLLSTVLGLKSKLMRVGIIYILFTLQLQLLAQWLV